MIHPTDFEIKVEDRKQQHKTRITFIRLRTI